MRFYNSSGTCYVCETQCESEAEVKEHLLYAHLTIIDVNDPDAFNFVKYRVLKPRMVDASNRMEPKLKCDLCGNGPFINNFGVVEPSVPYKELNNLLHMSYQNCQEKEITNQNTI